MEEGFLVEVRLSLFRRPSESPLGKKTEREKEQTQMQEAMGGGPPENYGWLEPQSSNRRYSGGDNKRKGRVWYNWQRAS